MAPPGRHRPPRRVRAVVDRPDETPRRPGAPPARSAVRVLALPSLVAGVLLGSLGTASSFASAGPRTGPSVSASPVGWVALLGPTGLFTAQGDTSLTPSAAVVDRQGRAAARPVTRAEVEVASALVSTSSTAPSAATSIPKTVLAAYHQAETTLATRLPGCHLPWWVLAGVGRIESGHASQGRVESNGVTRGPIIGDAVPARAATSQTAAPAQTAQTAQTAVSAQPSQTSMTSMADTDGGALDHNASADQPVGPMQFLPATWNVIGSDGNGDGVADPDNVYDASAAAGAYLCGVGGDLSVPANLATALVAFTEIHADPAPALALLGAGEAVAGTRDELVASGVTALDAVTDAYVSSVMTWGVTYRDSATVAPDATGLVPLAPPGQPVTSLPLTPVGPGASGPSVAALTGSGAGTPVLAPGATLTATPPSPGSPAPADPAAASSAAPSNPGPTAPAAAPTLLPTVPTVPSPPSVPSVPVVPPVPTVPSVPAVPPPVPTTAPTTPSVPVVPPVPDPTPSDPVTPKAPDEPAPGPDPVGAGDAPAGAPGSSGAGAAATP